MPDVGAIIKRLRAFAIPGQVPACVELAAAEAAVRSAVDAARSETWDAAQAEMDAIRKEAGAAVDARTAEIVKLLEDEADDSVWSPTTRSAIRAVAGLIARRFPNGGTNDG